MAARCVIPALILATALAGACEREAPRDTDVKPADVGSIRIVSLSPAMSRMLVDLGVEDNIVGRSGYCSMLDPTLPVIGNLTEIDFEILVRSRPTHVFVQPPAAGVDPALESLASEHGWKLVARRLDTVDDIAAMVLAASEALTTTERQPDQVIRQRGQRLADSVRAIQQPARAAGWSGPTLLVIPGDPALAFGAGTYLDELLRAHGGVNAVRMAGWIEMSLEDVTRLNPSAIVVVRSSAGSDASAAAGPLGSLDIEAVRAGRIAVLSHAEAQLPSTSVIEVADELAGILRAWAEGSL